MSEETKTELKLPKAYKRPSYQVFKSTPGYENRTEEEYVAFFEGHEKYLAEQYASGEVTDESFRADSDDEMRDGDGDGLPDVLHVKSQVRSVATRTIRTRQPTRHRFKQYLFGNPSLRLIRRRVLRVRTADVRIERNLDELITKEAAGVLSVHLPNGQRLDLQQLKRGAIVLSTQAAAPALPNPPLDSAASDIPAGENMPQHLGGTFPGDPAAARALEAMRQDKAAELEGKVDLGDGVDADSAGDFVDPAAARAAGADGKATEVIVPTELEQPPTGPSGELTPIAPAPETNTELSVEAPVTPEGEPLVTGRGEDQTADVQLESSTLSDTATVGGEMELPSKTEVIEQKEQPKHKGGSKKGHR